MKLRSYSKRTTGSLPNVNEYKRGQIYIADLDPTLGAEQGKSRRVLVVSNDIGNLYGPTVIGVPITTEITEKRLRMPMFVKLEPTKENGQTKVALIDCNQIRVLDKRKRILEYKGNVDETTMDKVDKALETCLALKRCYKCNHVLMPNGKHCVNKNCRSLQIHICDTCVHEYDARFNYCPMCGNKGRGYVE